MKKIALIFALGVFSFAGIQAAPVVNSNFTVVQEIQDENEIAPEDLPQAVKDTIAEKDETKDQTIAKAFQLTDEAGNVEYKVVFGTEEEGLSKKYDAEGNEIVETV
ncbi:hypothetical protein QWY93_14440 [Echinicola jeungdonensis]|uniref:PepSY domain-containing protein n=1 Tax=Echinicola jeungdonensis TaxID=709343 RepID=A0ABV5J998_9BACT|nr:hypothetical protein [Echinicola jeungdonensis]MDN3670518.1 hypothetical protein [Echinicola jeungdonensis]